MKNLCLAVVTLSITCLTTTCADKRLMQLSPVLNELPDTVQEVLSQGLSMEGTSPSGSKSLKVYQAPPKRGESPIYFIRLPPTKPFYSKRTPHTGKVGSKVPVSFRVNGRPHKVYHYNLPYRRRVAQHRRRQLPFHPHNHRSPPGQSFRAFITRQELAVPKPHTGLALPSLAAPKPRYTTKTGATAGSQQLLPGATTGSQELLTGAMTGSQELLPGAQPAVGNSGIVPSQTAAPPQHLHVKANAPIVQMQKFKTGFSKKMLPDEGSTFVEVDHPEDSNSLLGGEKVSTSLHKNLDLGIFNGKSQEKSQETFFESTHKRYAKIPSQGEEIFPEFAEKSDGEENTLADKKIKKAIKSRAQKVSWAS